METEIKVGEEFQFGLDKLRCEKLPEDALDSCAGCCFYERSICPINIRYCTGFLRTDKTDVIFKLVEE